MKKFFVFLLSMIPVVASGANYLDIKIQDLTRIKQERIAELEKCQDVTGGLKIAGLTTLGISTIGIAANVAEAVVLKQKKDAVTELDKDIEKLNAEIRVYNKLQEGKKVNKGNDIRCGGDVNITNNTYNVTRNGDTYQIQKDGDVYNIDVNVDVDGSIDIEKLLKGEKDYIDELIRGGKAVRKIEDGEDNISVKSNNGQGFHITVENNSGSTKYLVAVQDKKVKFGANVTLTCDFVTVSPDDGKVKIKYRVKDSGDEFSETAPTVTGENENKRIEYSVWVNDIFVDKGEFDCAFYKDDVVVVEEESEEDGISSVKVNKSKSTEHTVGNVKITCETVEITPDSANVEVRYSLTESGTYTTDMPEITSETPVTVYYKVMNKTTQAVVTDKEGKDLVGTIDCSSSVVAVEEESEEGDIISVESNNGQGFHITVENNSGSTKYLVAVQDKKVKFGANVTLTCDFVTVSPDDGKVKIKYRVKDSGDEFSETAPTVTGENENKRIEYSVWVNDIFVDKGEFDCAFYKDDVVVVEEESEEDGISSVKVNKSKSTEHTVGNVKITCETVEITPDSANVEVWYSLIEGGKYTKDMPEIPSGTTVDVYYKVMNKTTQAVVTDKDGKDLAGTISCFISEQRSKGPTYESTAEDAVYTYTGEYMECDGKVNVKKDGVDITENVIVYYHSGAGDYYAVKPIVKDVKDTKTIKYKVLEKKTNNKDTIKSNAKDIVNGEFNCTVEKAENPMKLNPASGSIDLTKGEKTVTFAVENAQGNISVQFPNGIGDLAKADYDADNKKITLTVNDGYNFRQITVAVIASGGPNYENAVKYYELTAVGANQEIDDGSFEENITNQYLNGENIELSKNITYAASQQVLPCDRANISFNDLMNKPEYTFNKSGYTVYIVPTTKSNRDDAEQEKKDSKNKKLCPNDEKYLVFPSKKCVNSSDKFFEYDCVLKWKYVVKKDNARGTIISEPQTEKIPGKKCYWDREQLEQNDASYKKSPMVLCQEWCNSNKKSIKGSNISQSACHVSNYMIAITKNGGAECICSGGTEDSQKAIKCIGMCDSN